MTHLFQFRKSQGVAVFGPELHESHVGRVGELCDDAETGKQPAGQKECAFTPTVHPGFFLHRHADERARPSPRHETTKAVLGDAGEMREYLSQRFSALTPAHSVVWPSVDIFCLQPCYSVGAIEGEIIGEWHI